MKYVVVAHREVEADSPGDAVVRALGVAPDVEVYEEGAGIPVLRLGWGEAENGGR